jgi:ribosomal protein S18 acetylase RimI-like enzyme
MSGAGEIRVSQILNATDFDFVFPNGFSFFEPYLRYHVKEILEIGGEAYVSRTPEGAVSGLFIHDPSEKVGTIYTRSREVFDYFYELSPFDFLFSEMSTEHESEIYDIYTVDLENLPIAHRFRYEITVADEGRAGELERFMVLTHPGINRRWVSVALKNGDRCFTAVLGSEIAGLGWLSLVNDIGRLHSLYVKPQFRRMGIAEDLLFARLLWLQSKHARSVFSEISRYNIACSGVEAKGQMTVSGQVFQYFKKEERKESEKSANVSQPLGPPHLGQTSAVESYSAPQYLQ